MLLRTGCASLAALLHIGCCEQLQFKVYAYDEHRAGLFTGDYVRAPERPNPRGEPTPAVVYVHFAEATDEYPSSVGVSRPEQASLDNDSALHQSWLLGSLEQAMLLTGSEQPYSLQYVELDGYEYYVGPQYEEHKRLVIEHLYRLFQDFPVLFTTTRPEPSVWFRSEDYMTVVVSRDSERVIDLQWDIRSYSPWDPTDGYRNEVAFVFDPAWDAQRAAISIAHTVGHMLGLEETATPGALMSHSGESWTSGDSEIVPSVPSGVRDTTCDIEIPARRSQQERALLAAHVGRRVYAEDGAELGDPFGGSPYEMGGGPGREPMACTFRQMRFNERDGTWKALYDCARDLGGGEEEVWIEERSVEFGGEPIEDPPVIEPGGGGGGGGGGTPPGEAPPVYVPPVPPESELDKARRRGKCLLQKGKAIANSSEQGKIAAFRPGERLKANETSCTKYLKLYAEGLAGQPLGGTAADLFRVPVPLAELDAAVEAGDLRTRGPAAALISLGWADEVDGLGQAVPGDIVQQWRLTSKGWVGHQWVVGGITAAPGSDGKLRYYLVKQGAHLGQISREQREVVDNEQIGSKRLYYIARLKPEVTKDCPP